MSSIQKGAIPVVLSRHVSPIHTTSLVAELAGLIDSAEGKLAVTPEYRTIMATHGPSGVYAHMFEVLQEITPLGNIYSPEEVFRSCYSTRCLDRFASFMGLVEIYRDLRSPWQHVAFSVKKLPLLDHVMPFNLEC
jgi:hypothetical protein